VAPSIPAAKILDPYAGEGAFLETAAKAWNVTPYANELDGERAAKCIERFGPKQAVRGDAERLIASNNAFQLLWCNPPYDHDGSGAAGNKRIELRYLRHSWKWAADGGIVMWVVYRQHITEER
jgi:tRNA G10  N-methylase Trm11